jgi:hypothetical protein
MYKYYYTKENTVAEQLTIDEFIDIFVNEMDRLNNYINKYGQIQRGSIIKEWHDWDNIHWLKFLIIALTLESKGHMRLDERIIRDCNTLVKHIDQYCKHSDNVLYPYPKATHKLSHRVTHLHRDTSIKSVAFKVVMNIREAYCEMMDIDLPNYDSSMGNLDATPKDTLFNWSIKDDT